MKTIRRNARSEKGTILFVTLIVTAILGAALASYLRLVHTQNYSVARSQAWNRAIPVLEAGIEEALAQIAKGTDAASMVNNGWTLSGTSYVKNRDLGGGDRFETRISVATPPTVESTGFVKIPLENNEFVARRVRVTTQGGSMYTKAMVARGQINLNGNNITTDSFDSQNPLYSTGGQYDPSKRRDNGDVATNSGLVNSLNVGNADIYGEVSTGPGGSISVGSNGGAGSLAWHAGGNHGIEPGYSSDDMNVSFPDVTAPFAVGLPPAPGNVSGTNYNYVLSNGNYSMSSLSMSGSANNRMLITGNARLYVTGNVSLSGSSSIVIAPGASLKMYVAGASASLGGNGVVNGSASATNFSYFGLPSNTSVSFSGNAAFTGTIYAPSAALSLGGGGNNSYDFVGASVSNTVQMNGHFNFHYDEMLGRQNNGASYYVTSWNEF